MGAASTYVCDLCEYRADFVTGDFDFGFLGVVVTPVICNEHGVVSAETGLKPGQTPRSSDVTYPCPECQQLCGQWDRTTCPWCRQTTMHEALDGPIIMWD